MGVLLSIVKICVQSNDKYPMVCFTLGVQYLQAG